MNLNVLGTELARLTDLLLAGFADEETGRRAVQSAGDYAEKFIALPAEGEPVVSLLLAAVFALQAVMDTAKAKTIETGSADFLYELPIGKSRG